MGMHWREIEWAEQFDREKIWHCRCGDAMLKIESKRARDPEGLTDREPKWFAVLYLLTPTGWSELKALPFLGKETWLAAIEALKSYAAFLYDQ